MKQELPERFAVLGKNELQEQLDEVFAKRDTVRVVDLGRLNGTGDWEKFVVSVWREGTFLMIEGGDGKPWAIDAKYFLWYLEEYNRKCEARRMGQVIIQNAAF